MDLTRLSDQELDSLIQQQKPAPQRSVLGKVARGLPKKASIFARSAIDEAAFGFPEFASKGAFVPEAETGGERLTEFGGRAAGFLAGGPLALGKAGARLGVKALGRVAKVPFVRGAVSRALEGGISLASTAITKPEEMGGRFKTGAAFGLAAPTIGTALLAPVAGGAALLKKSGAGKALTRFARRVNVKGRIAGMRTRLQQSIVKEGKKVASLEKGLSRSVERRYDRLLEKYKGQQAELGAKMSALSDAEAQALQQNFPKYLRKTSQEYGEAFEKITGGTDATLSGEALADAIEGKLGKYMTAEGGMSTPTASRLSDLANGYRRAGEVSLSQVKQALQGFSKVFKKRTRFDEDELLIAQVRGELGQLLQKEFPGLQKINQDWVSRSQLADKGVELGLLKKGSLTTGKAQRFIAQGAPGAVGAKPGLLNEAEIRGLQRMEEVSPGILNRVGPTAEDLTRVSGRVKALPGEKAQALSGIEARGASEMAEVDLRAAGRQSRFEGMLRKRLGDKREVDLSTVPARLLLDPIRAAVKAGTGLPSLPGTDLLTVGGLARGAQAIGTGIEQLPRGALELIPKLFLRQGGRLSPTRTGLSAFSATQD